MRDDGGRAAERRGEGGTHPATGPARLVLIVAVVWTAAWGGGCGSTPGAIACAPGRCDGGTGGGGGGGGNSDNGGTSGGGCLVGWPMPNPPASGLPHPQSYDTSNPAWVVDRVTGLTWQRDIDPVGFSWTAAVQYCGGLKVAGVGGWRLPRVIELLSLVDFTRTSPAIDIQAFPNTPSLPFWTAQADVTNSGLAWYVFFSNGGAYGGNDIVDVQRVRCVR